VLAVVLNPMCKAIARLPGIHDELCECRVNLTCRAVVGRPPISPILFGTAQLRRTLKERGSQQHPTMSPKGAGGSAASAFFGAFGWGNETEAESLTIRLPGSLDFELAPLGVRTGHRHWSAACRRVRAG
jgi:hypothetical protein